MRCLILVFLFLLPVVSHAFFWPFSESDDVRKAREAAIAQRQDFIRVNQIGKSRLLRYDSPDEDVNRGFRLIIAVDRAADVQKMRVYLNGRLERQIPVSTGFEARVRNKWLDQGVYSTTPLGRYVPSGFHLRHYTPKFHVNMPFTIWFGPPGWAIHAADGFREISKVGTRASLGCVRLLPQDAEWLYRLAREDRERTLIVIYDSSLSEPRQVGSGER